MQRAAGVGVRDRVGHRRRRLRRGATKSCREAVKPRVGFEEQDRAQFGH